MLLKLNYAVILIRDHEIMVERFIFETFGKQDRHKQKKIAAVSNFTMTSV